MEEIKFSQEIKELFSAILEFKNKVGKIYKTEDNPFFKAKYADLSAILNEVEPKLAETGLVITCLPTGNNCMTAMVVHGKSGQYMMTTFKLNIEPSQNKEKDREGAIVWRSDSYEDSQKWGAAVTYGRRFAIVSILNLNIDKDNDGNKPGEKPDRSEEEKKPFLNRTALGSTELLPEYLTAVEIVKKEGNLDSLKAQYRITKAVQQSLMTDADI